MFDIFLSCGKPDPSDEEVVNNYEYLWHLRVLGLTVSLIANKLTLTKLTKYLMILETNFSTICTSHTLGNYADS